MDRELKSWTGIGLWKKVRGNFREISKRLMSLEAENRAFEKRLVALEAANDGGDSETRVRTQADA